MRSQYESQLNELNVQLTVMGSLIEKSISDAVDSLIEQDENKANSVKSGDTLINQKEKEIENLCFKLLLHQQPVAKDLRLISSALKMITDMERIGDYAEDIAELALHLCQYEHIYKLKLFKDMGETCCNMVTGCIDAFVKKDVKKAQKVVNTDDVVDNLFVTIKKELINIILDNKNHSEQAIDLIMISKYLERIGDHAENIAQWAIYSISGRKTIK